VKGEVVQRSRSALAGVSGAALLALLVPAARAGELRALRISEANAAALLIGGPDATAGIGDWYLGNELVEFAIDDPARRHGVSRTGGTLIDAGLRDRRGEDQLARLSPLGNLSQHLSLGFDAARAEQDEGEARIVVTASRGPELVVRERGWFDWLNPLAQKPDSLRDVRAEIVYALRPGEPFLRIRTRFENRGQRRAPLVATGELWMHGSRGMRAWFGNVFHPELARGFQHRGLASQELSGGLDVITPVTFVAAAGRRDLPPIAYALWAPPPEPEGDGAGSAAAADPDSAEALARARGLSVAPLFAIAQDHVSVTLDFKARSSFEPAGYWGMFRAVSARLTPGEIWRVERRFLVSGRRDIAGITDLLFPLQGFADGRSGIAGRVLPAGEPAVIHVADAASGAPVTSVEAQANGAGGEAGRFRALLPPGDYQLTLRAPQRDPIERRVRVEAGSVAELEPFALPALAWLELPPQMFAGGGGGRVVVQGIAPTPDPVFGAELLGFELAGEDRGSGSETRELHFAGTPADPRRVPLRPGRYRLVAARDPLHDVALAEVELAAPGAAVSVPPFQLQRIAELPGMLSADLHVHSQASDDTGVAHEAQLRAFAAAGVQVLVVSEHENVADLAPALAALGLAGRIHVIQGVEVTNSASSEKAPWTLGHHNVWPIAYQRFAHRRGAPPSGDRTLAQLYADLRELPEVEVIQLNHARSTRAGERGDDGSFFEHLSSGQPFDFTRPLELEPNAELLRFDRSGRVRGIDFDVMERMNGRSLTRERALRGDWHALLRQGVRRSASANSDSHGLDELAGIPRNYVALADLPPGADPMAAFELGAFDAAIRDGRLFGTNGPLIERFEIEALGMGRLARARGGRARVELSVVAAPWVPVDEVRIVVNGEVARRFGDLARGSDGVMRFQRSEELRFERDAFVTLEAGAPLEAEAEEWLAQHPGLYTELLAPGFVSSAFANPIFVDADGNGSFDPPGL